MSNLLKKKPLSKNLCLSFTGKEPIFNSITLYNNFPIGLMIISKLDPISNRADGDEYLSKEEIDEQENEIKLKFINEHARDLFELKENDSHFRIKEQLMKFKLADNNGNEENKNDNLYSVIFHKEKNDFYGSFKNKNMIIWAKYNNVNDEIYLCADYFTDERKFIQNELFQSIKFQYIATLFHELYNPINAILVMMEQNNSDDDNLDYQDYTSEIEGSHFSLITENEFDKINCNFNENENINKDMNIKNDEMDKENINLLKKYEKCKRSEIFYRNNYVNMKEKENDVRLLVNIIYIFLEILILYLRLNLGDGKDNISGDISETREKKKWLSEDISQKTDGGRYNRRRKKVSSKTVINARDSKSFDKAKSNLKLNNDSKTKLYKDNYLDSGKGNKEINLEKAFLKHLKKFKYLFKFKNIQFYHDFSFLSNKYIYTHESIFFDFLGQIYSFLYYVVPKFHGFEISFNQINDNKIKLTFQKANCRIKTGYTHKKFQKKDSFILLGNKFKASNTVKTIEMTIEILNKLAKILDINLKIMDYEEKSEEKYLTILMPFYFGKKANVNTNEQEIVKKYEKDEDGHIEILDGNLIFVNSINHFDNIDESNLDNGKIEEMKNTTNKIIENINTKIINNNSLRHSSKKVSFQMNNKDTNSSNNYSNNNNNINSVNINININKNININNNFNTSSISSIISNNNKNLYKSINENYPNSPKNKSTDNPKEINNKSKTEKGKNMLTLIHEKYSFLDRLKKSGVEILTEKLDKEKSDEDEYEYKNMITEENNKKNNDKSSINVEADSENFFEIENDINNGIDDDNSSEEIIFNNNYNNVNLQIGEDYWNMYNKNINNVNIKSEEPSTMKKKSIIMPKQEKINSILKQKKKHLYNINNRYYNKTLSYSKSPKDILFVIPEIAENQNKKGMAEHPSCKLNNKYVSEFNSFSECGCHDILLVDDDEFICKTFKNILKKFKLQADTAENGQECIKMIKEKIQKSCKCDKNKYKIIFMDITMPVMDGIEAAKNIQKMIDNKEIYDSIKIVFVSAHTNLDLSSTISGIKCAVDYYSKPISADMYKNVLNKYYYEKS